MKINWTDVILILFGLFVGYQLLRVILGGSWQAESLIIAFLIFNFGIVWKINANIWKLTSKFEGHLGWHKARSEK